MLVLSRKKQESVMVGGGCGGEQLLKVTIIDIRGGSVRLGFDASANLPVHRTEVWERIRAENPGSQPQAGIQRPTAESAPKPARRGAEAMSHATTASSTRAIRSSD
jgi:carbon storage regulator